MSCKGGCVARTPGREPLLLLALLLLQLLGGSRLAWGSVPRAVLHVGPHKTATSYVQARLCGIRAMHVGHRTVTVAGSVGT